MSKELSDFVIGNYVLIKELGSGTWGTVYLAKHFLLENKPQVAIKILHASLLNGNERGRFFQEAYLLDKLTHPHILPIYDVGQYGDLPFLVVEYAPGGSLRERLEGHPQQPMEVEQAIPILVQIGLALQHAHDQDIVHRDLKPENILFNTDGDALLADFGIAMELRLTNVVREIGTPPYMAPEQFMGKMSKRSDQYALGCIAYEMLTGVIPFSANDIYTMGYRHIHEQPEAPRALNRKLPYAIEQTILRAIAKQRDQRYVSVKAFVDDLQRGLDNQGGLPAITASQSSVRKPVLEPIQEASQQELPASQSIDVHTAATPEPTPLRGQYTPPQQPRVVAGPSHQTSGRIAWSVQTGGFVRATPVVVNDIVYIGSWDKKLYALDASSGNLRWSVATGGAISSSACVAADFAYVGSFDHKLYAFNAANGAMHWSAATANFITSTPTIAQGHVYTGSWDYMLYAFDAASGKQRWASPTGDAISSSPVIANGVAYIGSRDGRLYAFNATTGTLGWHASTRDIISASPAVIEGTVYIGSWDKRLYAFDAPSGKQRWSVITHGAIGSSPTIVYGVIYIGSDAHILYAFDANTGQMFWSTQVGGAITGTPAVHNGLVYVGSEDGRIYAFNTATGAIQWIFTTQGAINSSPVIANGLLYIGSDDGHVYALHL